MPFLSAAGDLPLPAQLGILIPFLAAFAWIGLWLVHRYDQVSKEKDALYERLLAEVLPLIGDLTKAATDMRAETAAVRQDWTAEREARIRAEERNRR